MAAAGVGHGHGDVIRAGIGEGMRGSADPADRQPRAGTGHDDCHRAGGNVRPSPQSIWQENLSSCA